MVKVGGQSSNKKMVKQTAGNGKKKKSSDDEDACRTSLVSPCVKKARLQCDPEFDRALMIRLTTLG